MLADKPHSALKAGSLLAAATPQRRSRWPVAGWAVFAVLLALTCLQVGSGSEAERTHEAAAPYAFNLLEWEVGQVAAKLGPILSGLRGQQLGPEAADPVTVRAYFEAPPAARPPLQEAAEAAIERLVSRALRDEGLAAPWPLTGGASVVFPPVSFTFSAPPKVLIVSPRERIAVSQYVLLRPEVGPPEATRLEGGVARRGLSTLVTSIGGLASYPSMVLIGGAGEATLAGVAHEWMHAYFFFRPLGRGYWSSQDVRTINETAAELAGAELGRRLALQVGLRSDPRSGATPPGQADFNRLMRETRLEVDRLLMLGQVDAAESYMERRRLEINALGYSLRRLNQAYFAFFGSYAEGPAGSSPIAGQLRRLRDDSPTLGSFVRMVAEVADPEDLDRLTAGGR